ncbi:MAG: hypothetical protein H6623_03940 [Bdellovibrionaceae bacterium]|nr:hypothetical protein [Pseudobdellovibrionaceae bacterium]
MKFLLALLTHITILPIYAQSKDLSLEQRQHQANNDKVLPTYTQIDNSEEKTLPFSWGNLYYRSVTDNNEEDDHSKKDMTQLTLRYTCKNKKQKPAKIKHFEFCGYAVSKVDTKQKQYILNELKKMNEHKKKTDAELEQLYNAEYNDRVVNPEWSIAEKKTANSIEIEISVRNKKAALGSCEDKVSLLKFPINCK